MCCVQTVEHYRDLARKKNKVLIPVTPWIILSDNQNVTLRSQTRKATYCRIPFLCNVQNRKIYRNRKQNGGRPGWGKGKWGLIGYVILFWGDGKVLKLFGVMDTQLCKETKNQ